jgi:DNA-binding NtrC family response regulator
VQKRVGLVEQCTGGTLFLDEIADMPLALQAKLLRVVEEQRVRKLGSNVEVPVDVRVAAATHCDLKSMVAEGKFREDLYFRLRGIELSIPPLRKRKREIVLLAELFLRNACRDQQREMLTITAQAIATLESHNWPGNVRELRQVMESSLVLCEGTTIEPAHLIGLSPVESSSSEFDVEAPSTTSPAIGVERKPNTVADFTVPLAEEIRRLEVSRIEQALDASGGNRTQAAKLLGMPRRTLMHKLSLLGMSKASASSRD